jgi:hypothetical protein
VPASSLFWGAFAREAAELVRDGLASPQTDHCRADRVSASLPRVLIVGGLSFPVKIATLALRRAAMPVIPASLSNLIVVTVANYLLSILPAFQRGRFHRQTELAPFLIVCGRFGSQHGAGVDFRPAVCCSHCLLH